jgi:hypothetical protein
MASKTTNDPPQTQPAACAEPPNEQPHPDEAERQRRDRLREEAWAAYQRDFAQLARDHYQQWVAYLGGQQLGIARTQTELYEECLGRGLRRGEFQVFGIEHPLPDNLSIDWPVIER